MIDSNNIEIIRDNLKELDQRIDSIDVEIPAHTSGDAGKYLGVDASGDLEFSNPPGKYDLEYSETEVNTGRKWIDNKDVYSIVLTGSFPEMSASTTLQLGLTVDTLISIFGVVYGSDGNGFVVNHNRSGANLSSLNVTNAGDLTILIGSAFSNGSYKLVCNYTKPTPEPGLETLTKKKKSK